MLNALCGAKVSIVSPVPQTTRNAVRGIVTRDDCQLVFIDTPGMHISNKKYNKRLTQTAVAALSDADIILYLIDSTRPPGAEEEEIARKAVDIYGGIDSGLPGKSIIIAVNKIDAKESNAKKCTEFIDMRFPGFLEEHIVMISALEKTNLDVLLNLLQSLAAPGPFYYDGEFYTDQDVQFRISEIVREKCCLLLREEIPHAVYVDVTDAKLQGKSLSVSVFIRCERESQKGMIVGKNGEMIHKIRAASLLELKKIFDWNIKLDMRVKTDKNWRQRVHNA